MKRLSIIGAGHLGQQIAYHAISDKQFEVAGFFDDTLDKNSKINQLPVLGSINDVETCFKEGLFEVLLIGIGYRHMQFRKDLYLRYKKTIPFARFIHSSCIVDDSSSISDGVVIYPGAILDQNVIIQENVLLNIGCCIAHDSIIGAHSFISPRVAIAGFVKIEECCNLGINATIIDNITIAANTQVGGGSVVIKNIEKRGLYVGNPVRYVR